MDRTYAFTVRTHSFSWLPGVRVAVGGSFQVSAPIATPGKPLLWWLYGFDSVLLVSLGILFASYGPWTLGGFGVPQAGPVLWPAVGLTRLFGAALIALGIAAMGVWWSPDPQFREAATGYFRNGHLVLAAVCLLQNVSTLEGRGRFVLINLLLLPWVLFWNYRLSRPPKGAATAFRNPEELRDEWERRIREAAGQQERNRLAQDLHDSIKQQIYAIQTHLAAAEARAGEAAVAVLEPLEHARSSARQAMAEMNAMLDQLRASPLESVGLVEALRRQCEALGYRTGAEVTAEIGDLPPTETLPPGAPAEIFRIAQEALSNVARHARASHVRLTLEARAAELTLRIRDDGQGFHPGEAPAGMGLKNMQARAAALGSTLRIDSAPGEGCTVLLCLPLEAPWRRALQGHLRIAGGAGGFAALLGAPLWLLDSVSPDERSCLLPLVLAAALAFVYHGAAAARLWRNHLL